VLLAGLLEAELCAQVNAEGVHVDPRMMQMLYRLKGAEGIILTSDLHPAGGLPPGTYTVEGYEVETDGEIMRMPDGTFVGSALALDQGVRTVVNRVGVPLTEAVRMASHNPARELGLEDRKGRIAPGYDADLAVMNGDLEVEMTLVGGRVVYRAE
jgi:N-acetylglucosamine-6-phosphate deacetylase